MWKISILSARGQRRKWRCHRVGEPGGAAGPAHSKRRTRGGRPEAPGGAGRLWFYRGTSSGTPHAQPVGIANIYYYWRPRPTLKTWYTIQSAYRLEEPKWFVTARILINFYVNRIHSSVLHATCLNFGAAIRITVRPLWNHSSESPGSWKGKARVSHWRHRKWGGRCLLYFILFFPHLF